MIYGHNPQAEIVLPQWANTLKNYYWYIRVEGRDKVKKRRYYRLVRKEKLRLVESGLDQHTVESTCRYLSGFNDKTGDRLQVLLHEENLQLKLDFI